MKVNPAELKDIKSKMLSVLTVLNEDFFHLKEIRKSLGIRIYAVTLWDRWLTQDEYAEVFYCSKEEEQLRREKFTAFYSTIVNQGEKIYTWKYNKRKQRNEIRKLTLVKQNKNLVSIENYNINHTNGIFELILPEYSAILEMKSDWTCTLICNDKQDNSELFGIIKKAGLKYFEH